MASWTAIQNSALQPDAPARSIDALALRDNPIAIADGETGAPRIKTAALDVNAVLAATARDAAAGAVGTYVFARVAADVTFGSTVAGSSLVPTGAAQSVTVNVTGTGSAATSSLLAGGALTGTYRCMGSQDSENAALGFVVELTLRGATLWLRIA